METNELGEVISYEEYHPFGSSAYRVEKSGTNLSLKRYRFTNKERDDETGLYYFGVRYYAAWLGRWSSSDPGGFVDGLNVYQYGRNNPVMLVDEDGYMAEPPPECKDCPTTYSWGGGGNGTTIAADNESGPNITIASTTNTIAQKSPRPLQQGLDQYKKVEPKLGSVPNIIKETAKPRTMLETTPIETIKIEELTTGSFVGDLAVGEVPYLGTSVDVMNAGIAYDNGDYLSAALYSLAAIPVLGMVFGILAKSGKAAKVIDDAPIEGGITGVTSEVVESNITKSVPDVNPSGGSVNCVGCAEAMYKQLDGDYEAISKFTDDDLGDIVTDISFEKVVQYKEKTGRGFVEKYLDEGGFKLVDNGRGGTRLAGPEDIIDVMSKQQPGTHFLVTASTHTGGHAFNILKTFEGPIVILESQKRALFMEGSQAFNHYLDIVAKGKINFWTK